MSESVKGKKQRKPKRKLLIIIVVIIGVIFGATKIVGKMFTASKESTSMYLTSNVEARDITCTLKGSSSLKPSASYTVTTLNQGSITKADFEEGSKVKTNQLLYLIDNKNDEASAKNSLAQLNRNYSRLLEQKDKLHINATISGNLTGMDLKIGETVTQGQTLGTLIDSSTMTISLPFPADDAAKFYIGQSADVMLDGSFEIVKGTVSKIANNNKVLKGNRIVKLVSVTVVNPGAIDTTHRASAMINKIASSDIATFAYGNQQVLTAPISGEVAEISINNGDSIKLGEQIIRLKSSTLEDQLIQAKNAITDSKNSEQYSVYSPIAGTVVDKSYKLGDTVERGKNLCVIYDLSYLTMTIQVDELDIQSVKVGQKAKVLVNAVSEQEYTGVVTRVGINGVTENGITVYPVTIKIEQTENLLPGMNANAELIIANEEQVISIPIEAVARKNYVLLPLTSPAAKNALPEPAPEGYCYVEVKTGISDGKFVQILSGLSSEDTVAYVDPKIASILNFYGK